MKHANNTDLILGIHFYKILGVAAALLSVLIWAGWIVATRHSVVSHLGPVDVGIVRFSVPAVVLAPFWIKVGLVPKDFSVVKLVLLVSGSGTVFFLIAATGMNYSPAAHVGALMPGTIPLWSALIGWMIFKENIGLAKTGGFLLIALGVGVISLTGISSAVENQWYGKVLLLTAALLWSIYTHVFKKSAFSPLQAAGLVSIWSLLVHILLAAIIGSDLATVPANELILQLTVQGGLTGILGLVAFGFAVNRLGAIPAASFAGFVPVLSALGGYVFLQEALSKTDLFAIMIISFGVIIASGVFNLTKNRPLESQ